MACAPLSVPAVTLLSAAPRCLRSLAGFACAIVLLASAHAVAPFKFPSAQLRNEPLKEEKSIKGQKLTAYHPESAAIHRKSPKEMPANYSRPQKGNHKTAPRPAPLRYAKGGGKPARTHDKWDADQLARNPSLLPSRRGNY